MDAAVPPIDRLSDFMAWEESLAIKDASEAQTAFDAEEDPQAAPAGVVHQLP